MIDKNKPPPGIRLNEDGTAIVGDPVFEVAPADNYMTLLEAHEWYEGICAPALDQEREALVEAVEAIWAEMAEDLEIEEDTVGNEFNLVQRITEFIEKRRLD